MQKDKATKPAGSGLMPGRVKHRAKTPKSCRSCHVVPSPKILLKNDLRLILRDRRNCYFPRFSMEFEGRFALRWGACRATKVFKSPIRERTHCNAGHGAKGVHWWGANKQLSGTVYRINSLSGSLLLTTNCLQLPFRLGAAIFEFDAAEWTISSTINFSRTTWGSLSSLAMVAWE